MPDKRGKWSKKELKKIWKDYIENKIYNYYRAGVKNKYNLAEIAPCPWKECKGDMLKAQYQGHQSDKDYSWDVDHINGDYNNNNLANLQPMHPWCNKQKSR